MFLTSLARRVFISSRTRAWSAACAYIHVYIYIYIFMYIDLHVLDIVGKAGLHFVEDARVVRCVCIRLRNNPRELSLREREFFGDNLLVRIH